MKNLLVMNFFPAFTPPGSGGELRYFNIYKNLDEYFDITLLSPTFSYHKAEIIEHSATLRERRAPKEEIHDRLHLEIDDERIGDEFSALVCALSARVPNHYHRLYLDLYPRADIIIHESPYMLDYDLFFGFDHKPRIYNSYNFEALLVDQMWSGPNSQKYKKIVYDLEKRLVLKSDLVFATSGIEKEAFIKEFGVDSGKMKIAPNGINPGELKYSRKLKKAGRIKAFFIGSAHPPNFEAVDFILNDLCGKCPGVDFYIAGTCCKMFDGIHAPNVHLLGKIEEKQKNELFCEADVAINPMFSGAGTNLKTLEFLSAGIPLISTEKGVRGLDVIDGHHFILAEKEDFAEKLNIFTARENRILEMADRGEKHINKHYAWGNIAKNIRDGINNMQVENKKKVILLLNDFQVSNPSAGGEIRINRLYAFLSEYYRILLLCLNNEGLIKRTEITDNYTEISFPKTAEHLDMETKMNAKFNISTTDITNSRMCVKNSLLKSAVSRIGDQAHALVFSHPYMAPLVDAFKNDNVIYESHNCEYALKKELLCRHPKFKSLINRVLEIEGNIFRRSKFVISVSDEDHEDLVKLGTRGDDIVTISNGVEIKEEKAGLKHPRVKTLFKGHPVIVFIGSGHPPNIEAVNFIIDEIAPRLPHCYFAIIGSVCNVFARNTPPNVLLFYRLDEAYKDVLLRVSDVAVNPMFSGSGSNLKLAEYFANKIPVVTTSMGARGYTIESGREALICEAEDFVDAVIEILENEKLRSTLTKNAYAYVKTNLDWEVLAGRYRDVLRARLSPGNRKKLLVVTYRFTDPPLGGAEAYLLNVIKEIDKIGDFAVDIAALDIHDVVNKFHFSSDYTFPRGHADSFNFGNVSGLKFKTDELPEPEKFQNAKKLFDVWMRGAVENSLHHVDRYSDPMLMGGWHYPEKMNDCVEIWSGEDALIFVKGVEMLAISAFSPKKRLLKIYLDKDLVYEKKVKNRVDLEFNINNAMVLRIVIPPMRVKGLDPRPLGLRVSSVSYHAKRVKKELRLDYDYCDFLREKQLDSYVGKMIEIARERDGSIDDIFQQTRGPGSKELEEWLDKNIKNYDIVLGHSAPFRTLVMAVDHAKKHNRPVALLPHFHFEDAFYHWNSYYTAFQRADLTFAAPRASISAFYEKIQARTCDVPGGGIFKDEFNASDSADFKKLNPSPLPFILVLGRKSGAKNYQWVIDAVKKVNQDNKICRLIIIGRDEDGLFIDEVDTVYLGEQPRSVVLGALKECLCLVNMSESESFGIVLLEAWMFKRPVIINKKCRAFLELVSDGVNGIVTDKDGLPEAVRSMIVDRQKADRMGRNGLESLAEQYAWENIALTMNNTLLRLAGE